MLCQEGLEDTPSPAVLSTAQGPHDGHPWPGLYLMSRKMGFDTGAGPSRGLQALALGYLGHEAGQPPSLHAGIGWLRSNPGNAGVSQGSTQTSRPAHATGPGYLEDAATVPVMVSTYKAWIELWENHLASKQVVWSGRQKG